MLESTMPVDLLFIVQDGQGKSGHLPGSLQWLLQWVQRNLEADQEKRNASAAVVWGPERSAQNHCNTQMVKWTESVMP